ncbi:hypothetical protein SAMN06265373_102584 [Shimia sagamensis]|uniref:Uncharacterized protein n=1 Tax=Shimia sagamensis TaxID=1566352 RepID=A0ABY1NMP2_9RHOB|nr:hypothetical protein SAMN06265373_102584 [Shimia sagamensis]
MATKKPKPAAATKGRSVHLVTGHPPLTPKATALPDLAGFCAGCSKDCVPERGKSDHVCPLKLECVLSTQGLCCTSPVRDSLRESKMIVGKYEQLGTHEIQDHELVVLQ